MAKLDGITIKGLESVKRAFKELPQKVARKVIRQAEREAAKLFADEIRAHMPVASGQMKSTVKVRSSKGPRAWKKGNVSIAVLAGEAGKKGEGELGIKKAFYTFMQERGFHVGKRLSRGKKVIGYRRATGNLGAKGVHFIQGKHFVKHALKSRESPARELLVRKILIGIEREARLTKAGARP